MEKEIILQKGITIAVFPFENLTPVGEADIFCKAFAIDLITELSRFRQFQIVSYDTVEEQHNRKDIEYHLSGMLEIDYYVKGSFRQWESQIRINVQLINSKTYRVVWSDRFTGESEELMDIQENLLVELVSSLQAQLKLNLLSVIRKKPKINLEAYECWLYGMEELKKGSLENDVKAREYFQQAIDIDPGYSLAYSGISLTYFNEWSCQLWDRWELSQNGAFKWAQKAIELDEQNYVASCVLGRVFLYQRAFETAEHYLRKSLRLNSNDPESLINIALCFNYLGYEKEAFHLYEKALRLNPAASESYYPIGTIIAFELGDMEKAIAIANRSGQIPYVDFKAYCAAAWYELGNEEKMNECLSQFLECYSMVINKEPEATLPEAIAWMSNINPFKNGTRLEKFWAHITEGKINLKKRVESTPQLSYENRIRQETDFWEFTYDDDTIRLAAVKGFSDIKVLIDNPGIPVHCSELMGVAVLSNGETVIDEKAKEEYRKKITELQNDLAEADDHQDYKRAEVLQEEYEQLIEHLSDSLGLQGKIRQIGNPVEKARSAVTWRIRNAISKIEQDHSSLGKHLSNSIKTGTFCSYEPEKPIEWIF